MDLDCIDRQIRDLVKLRIQYTGADQAYFLLMTYVSEITTVSWKEIMSKRRTRRISDARCLLIYHMFQEGYSKHSISKVLRLNHVSVLEQLKKYKNLYESDYDFRHMANKLNEVWKAHSATL